MATLQLALQKTSSIKMFEQPRQGLRGLVGIGKPVVQQRIVRPPDIANPRVGESFTHLKLTAEKMLQEQACVRSDLEIANSKLAKAEEELRALEAKNQEISNENAMLKVKHSEDTKLWTSVETKVSSASAFFEQITETLHALENQVQQAEATKKLVEERLLTRDEVIEKDLARLRTSLQEATLKLETAEKNSEYKQLLLKEQESAAQKIAALEKTLLETRKQSELQLEAKQADIAKHLRELSQKNDQAMLEMKRHEINKLQESHKQALEQVSAKHEELQSKYNGLLLSMKKVEAELEIAKAKFGELSERDRRQQSDLADNKKELELVAVEKRELEKKLNDTVEDLQKKHMASLTRVEAELERVKARNEELLERQQQQQADLADKKKELDLVSLEKSDIEKKLKDQIEELQSKLESQIEKKAAEAPPDAKKTYAKRKRVQSTATKEATPKTKPRASSRKKPTKKQIVSLNDDDDDDDGNDLFGEGCLDPYADDPYAFG
ncbi:hypothetical protein SELMODRAFT_426465 [Selaginella moellendorffii]|uniref:Uncharacterized protein n=1 Tax=Selaginella moellendorffii TaxID=88036 RepID=D8SWG2_SELML|nr:synaptonemal complex protein 2 [Selaginella moellendorffii]EFJ11290.1 hypothetical protein SELMODRAFT_426465 [Selaginella moellendorffii]|eukprot:XP_002987715.1 synaptonemal complex protein 2 [Selaginella moellendorffii]